MVYADLSLSIYDRDPAQVDIDAITKDLVTRYQPFAFVDGTHLAAAKLVETFLGRPYGFASYEAWLNEQADGKSSMK